jgi:hypothetical protein
MILRRSSYLGLHYSRVISDLASPWLMAPRFPCPPQRHHLWSSPHHGWTAVGCPRPWVGAGPPETLRQCCSWDIRIHLGHQCWTCCAPDDASTQALALWQISWAAPRVPSQQLEVSGADLLSGRSCPWMIEIVQWPIIGADGQSL